MISSLKFFKFTHIILIVFCILMNTSGLSHALDNELYLAISKQYERDASKHTLKSLNSDIKDIRKDLVILKKEFKRLDTKLKSGLPRSEYIDIEHQYYNVDDAITARNDLLEYFVMLLKARYSLSNTKVTGLYRLYAKPYVELVTGHIDLSLSLFQANLMNAPGNSGSLLSYYWIGNIMIYKQNYLEAIANLRTAYSLASSEIDKAYVLFSIFNALYKTQRASDICLSAKLIASKYYKYLDYYDLDMIAVKSAEYNCPVEVSQDKREESIAIESSISHRSSGYIMAFDLDKKKEQLNIESPSPLKSKNALDNYNYNNSNDNDPASINSNQNNPKIAEGLAPNSEIESDDDELLAGEFRGDTMLITRP